jgi:acetylornithine deacetylase/succinyl-diaminopimelate desuccinylase-like protein
MLKPTTDPVRLLRELVALPSVHPEADSGGTIKGEEAIADWIRDYLRSLGVTAELRLLATGRPSVVASFRPNARSRATVVLAPHLDTVGVAGMTVPAFRLTERDGRLHGRGACDTKGPMAALLAALTRWTQSRSARHGATTWVFAATAGEEQGSLGAQALVRNQFKADFAVALEPTELRVVYAAKGLLRVWIEVPGRSAHGATPHRGRNAIYRATPIVEALRSDFIPYLRERVHRELGRCSLNVGIIEGGQELNLVPNRCRLGLDIRLHPLMPRREVLAALRRLAREHARDATLTIHREGPPFVTERTGQWARALRSAGRGWDTADWFCDANIFASAGIPSVAFGPGDIAQAHTRDEFITRRDLLAGTEAFGRFLGTSPI